LTFRRITSKIQLRIVDGFCFRFTESEEPEAEGRHPGRLTHFRGPRRLGTATRGEQPARGPGRRNARCPLAIRRTARLLRPR
jgi:hypothetical protein